MSPNYPTYSDLPAIAKCPQCGNDIDSEKHISDLFGMLGHRTSGLAPSPQPRYKTQGLAPPMDPPAEWRCPGCSHRWQKGELKFKMEESVSEEKSDAPVVCARCGGSGSIDSDCCRCGQTISEGMCDNHTAVPMEEPCPDCNANGEQKVCSGSPGDNWVVLVVDSQGSNAPRVRGGRYQEATAREIAARGLPVSKTTERIYLARIVEECVSAGVLWKKL